jgi:hypothetical protein
VHEWVFKFAQKGIDEVVEGVDGGEAWHVVAFILLNREVDFLAGEALRQRSVELLIEHAGQGL